MKKIVIFGTGGHAKIILSELLKQKNYNQIIFISKEKKKYLYFNKKKYKIIKNFKIKSSDRDKTYGVIAIGDNYLRYKLYKKYSKIYPKLVWATIKSKDAIVNKNVKLSPGSMIITGSIINAGSIIGKHCIINTKSSIDHDNIFSDFSSAGPGVITGGKVKVGKLSHIGIGSVVCQNVDIANNTIIGGKSFVNKNCEKNSVYFGTPAKKRKNRKTGSKYL